MLAEAMAQLQANSEKMAAAAGKGPTWEQKVTEHRRNISYQIV